MTKATIKQILQELGAKNKDEALKEIIKLKLGYQPWRDRRGEILSKSFITDAERQELKELEAKMMPLGWRAPFEHSHEDVRVMELIRDVAKLIKEKNDTAQ